MQRTGNGRAPSAGEDVGRLQSELEDRQRRLSFLVHVTESNLQQILLAIKGTLESQGGEAGVPVWSKEKGDTLRQLHGLVERAQRDVHLASTSSLQFSSSEALPDREAQSVFRVAPGRDQSRVREDEVAKAHQLARLVHERNAMKAKLVDAEGRIAELKQNLACVTAKHDKLLQTVACSLRGADIARGNGDYDCISQDGVSSDAVREAMRQLYDRRIQELEDELMSAKEELLLLHKRTGCGGTLTSKCLSSGRLRREDADKGNGVIDSSGVSNATNAQQEELIEGLRRQNTFLRNKLARLKEELQISQQASLGSAEQLNEGLDALLKKIAELQQELMVKERQVADALLLQEEARRESARLSTQLEIAQRKMAQAQREELSCPPNAARKGGSRTRDSIQVQVTIEALEEELKAARENAQRCESRTTQLTLSLSKARALLHKEEVEREALLLELAEARGICESAREQWDHSNAQKESIAKMEAHVKNTLEALLQPNFDGVLDNPDASGTSSSTADTLRQRLDDILQRILSMNALDLQLRQRGDEIVILQDEKWALTEQNQHLQRTLSNLSLLFRLMPQTPADLEHLILERDVFLFALQRCEQLSEVPNVRETLRNVELRKIDLEARREKQQQQGQPEPSVLNQLQLEHHAVTSPRSPPCNGSKASPTTHALDLSRFRFPDKSPSVEVMEEGGDAELLSSPRLWHTRPVGDVAFFSAEAKAPCK